MAPPGGRTPSIPWAEDGPAMTLLLKHSLDSKQDLLRLRQRTRQIVRALGYGDRDQMLITATEFHLGCLFADQRKRCSVQFDVNEGKLLIVPISLARATTQDASDLERVRLEYPLPRLDGRLDVNDLAWAVLELDQMTPSEIFEEMRQLNAEMLWAMHELQTCRSELGRLQRPRPDAA
jgi:hypothetical protein